MFHATICSVHMCCCYTTMFSFNNTLAALGTAEKKNSDKCQQVSFKASNIFITIVTKIVQNRAFYRF